MTATISSGSVSIGNIRFGAQNRIAPKQDPIIVVDNFSDYTMSGGPNALKTTHGDFVCGVLRSELPKRQVIQIDRKLGTTKILNNIAKKIDQGKRYAAVNISLACVPPNSEELFSFFFSMQFPLEKKVTPENIHLYKNELKAILKEIYEASQSGNTQAIKEKLRHWYIQKAEAQHKFLCAQYPWWEKSHPIQHPSEERLDSMLKNYAEEYEFLQAIEAVTYRGVPVYIGGGNEDDDFFNLYLLADGAIGVGALDQQGHKTDYTADHSLIQRFAIGNYEQRTVLNRRGEFLGLDLNKDGQVDIPAKRFKPGPVSEDIIGKAVSSKLVSDDEHEAYVKGLRLPLCHCSSANFFSTQKLRQIATEKYPEKLPLIKQLLGNTKDKYIQHHFSYVGFYNQNTQGNIKAGNSMLRQVDFRPNIDTGTSFATPQALAKDLKQKMAPKSAGKQGWVA